LDEKSYELNGKELRVRKGVKEFNDE